MIYLQDTWTIALLAFEVASKELESPKENFLYKHVYP